MDAINSNDVVKLRKIFTKYSSKRRPTFNETPATFDTPIVIPDASPAPGQSVRSDGSSKTTSSKRSISDGHSLDTFFEKYTSEDNQSFEEIIEAADERLRQKFAILYDAEDSQAEMIKGSLALPSIEKQFEAIERPNKVDTWTYKNKNYIMYIPDGVEYTAEEKIEMAKCKQEISHSNTRLVVNPFNDSQDKEKISKLAENQAKTNCNKVGLDGKLPEQQTPHIRGFSFVKSPSPCPSLIDSSPLMTWGEIEGTPFRLDASDTPLRPSSSSFSGPSFRIAEASKRETLGLQLAESVSEKHRAKKLKAIEAAKRNMAASPHVRNSLERLANMSPAARRLSSVRLAPSGWATPSPRINRTPLVTPKRKSAPASSNNSTPRSLQNYSDTDSTLTDNLLDIPSTSKRQKAADFF